MCLGVPMFECSKPSQSWKHAIAHVNCGSTRWTCRMGYCPSPQAPSDLFKYKYTQAYTNTNTYRNTNTWGIIPPQQHPVTYSNTKLYVADKKIVGITVFFIWEKKGYGRIENHLFCQLKSCFGRFKVVFAAKKGTGCSCSQSYKIFSPRTTWVGRTVECSIGIPSDFKRRNCPL